MSVPDKVPKEEEDMTESAKLLILFSVMMFRYLTYGSQIVPALDLYYASIS